MTLVAAMALVALATAPIPLNWSKDAAAPGARGALWDSKLGICAFSAENRPAGRELILHTSRDGKAWEERGVVTTDADTHCDLGDGNIVRVGPGELWTTYRLHHHAAARTFSIRVSRSLDDGKTWKELPVVESVTAEKDHPTGGFWAPLLFVTPERKVQLYYDDEVRPRKENFPGHQWITMRTWRDGEWSSGTVVAREPEGLSRDGMATVIATGKNRLLCIVEAVRKEAPHSGVLRAFRSKDGGVSWSGPQLVYAPADDRYHAFSPTLARFGGALRLVFSCNEGNATSPLSGHPAHEMGLHIAEIDSSDNGVTWTAPRTLYAGSGRCYLPSFGVGRHAMSLTFLDFDAGARCMIAHAESLTFLDFDAGARCMIAHAD